MGDALNKRWYVVHAFSGFEKQVMRALLERIELSGLEEKFGEVLVPSEEVVEMKAGKKRRSERKFFPGYVLVEMERRAAQQKILRSLNRPNTQLVSIALFTHPTAQWGAPWGST